MSPKKQKPSKESEIRPSQDQDTGGESIDKHPTDQRPGQQELMGDFVLNGFWGDEYIVDPKEVKVQHDGGNGPSLSDGWHMIDVYRRMVDTGGFSFLPLELRAKELEKFQRIHNKVIAECQTRARMILNTEPDRAPVLAAHIAALVSELPESLSLALAVDTDENTNLLQQLADADQDTVGDFMDWHGKYLKEKNENMQPEFERYKEKFTNVMLYAIKHQKLPLTLRQLQSRMENVSISLADPLAMKLEKMGGYYDVTHRDIYVAATLNPNNLKSVVFHELMHHISGQTVTDRDEDAAMYGHVYGVGERSGLAFPNGSRAPAWINEALTEQLTQIMLSDEDIDFSTATMKEFFTTRTGTYDMERDATCITMEDIPLTTILKAYFEDAVPADDGDTLPAARELWHDVIEQLGYGFVELARKYSTFWQKPGELRKFLDEFRDITIKEVPTIVRSELSMSDEALRAIFGLASRED